MASKNDITGDLIQTKIGFSDEFDENFTKIFGNKRTNGGWTPPPLPDDFDEEETDEENEDLDNEEED